MTFSFENDLKWSPLQFFSIDIKTSADFTLPFIVLNLSKLLLTGNVEFLLIYTLLIAWFAFVKTSLLRGLICGSNVCNCSALGGILKFFLKRIVHPHSPLRAESLLFFVTFFFFLQHKFFIQNFPKFFMTKIKTTTRTIKTRREIPAKIKKYPFKLFTNDSILWISRNLFPTDERLLIVVLVTILFDFERYSSINVTNVKWALFTFVWLIFVPS